jgi:hypothetical protein
MYTLDMDRIWWIILNDLNYKDSADVK